MASRVLAVIFDIDGTLIDSVDGHARSWQETLARYGCEVSFEQVRGQIGKGGDQLMPVFLSEDVIKRLGKQIEKERGDLFKSQYLPQVKAFPGSRELVRRVQAEGMKAVIASSAKQGELKTYLRIAGIDDLIDDTTTSDDVEKSKPHPDIFQSALGKLDGVGAGEALAVGDTPYDAESAGKAGLRTVGVLCGGFPEADLRKAGCVAIYRDPADLLARFETSPLGSGKG